jgi:isopenicillin-N epimerase
MKELFLLNPDVIYLNHGAFGATPRAVFKVYQKWQRELERQPTHFFSTILPEKLAQVEQILSRYLNADENSIILLPNVTFAVNMIARSMNLKPGDEILATDHEYGACDLIWRFVCQKTGAKYIQQHLTLPFHSKDDLIEQFWCGINQRTKLIFISHITSPTAMIFPVREICHMAREAGILSFVDGAHAPGQIPVSLKDIDADFYAGNCHKWMLAPKGSAFLYARSDKQHLIEPLIVSWGWGANESTQSKNTYLDKFVWIGTRDPSAYLSIPSAIQFQEEHQWEKVRTNCHQLLKETIDQINLLTGLQPMSLAIDDHHAQMGITSLPEISQPSELKSRLYQEYHIEIPITHWNNRFFLRISVQGYNTREDLQKLVIALKSLLPLYTPHLKKSYPSN